jgi:hypothetical protein
VISVVAFALNWVAHNAGLLNIERLSKLMRIPL